MTPAAIPDTAESGTLALGWPARVGVLLAGAGIYFGAGQVTRHLWAPFVYGWLPAEGSPFRALMRHALEHTLMTAALCLLGWWGLSKLGLLSSPVRLLTLGPDRRRTVLVGLGVTAAMLAYTLLGAAAVGIPFQFNPLPWLMVGNVFSNMYEEIIYRGLMIHVGLAGLQNRHLALLVTAVVFAAVHTQYPWSLRLVMLPAAWLFGFAYVRSGSLLAPWIAHQVVDMIGDTILKV